MKTDQFIAEIPMNPGAYMASLSQAEQLGIMVGFEFEICCKPKIAKAWHKSTEHKKPSFIEKSVHRYWYKNLSFSDISDTFDSDGSWLKNKTWYGYCWYKLTDYFQPELKNFFGKFKGDLKKEFSKAVEGSALVGSGKDIAGLSVIRNYKTFLSKESIREFENLGGKEFVEEISEVFNNVPVDLIKDIFTTLNFKNAKTSLELYIPEDDYRGKVNFAARFIKDEKLAEKIDDEEYESEDLWDDHNNYGYFRNPIAQAVRSGLGVNVEVFVEYHQKRKKWDRWYVEPDNSVEADEPGDGIAEIVSPPIPANQALAVLDQFYDVAKANGFYSNSSTGLHINVSLPTDTDILKLALLVGENFVLKTFDREDSEYAMSVLAELQGGGKADDDYFSKIQKARTFNNKEKYLRAMTKGIMGAHCSSMTIGPKGKYISFRGVGNSYLQNQKQVKEALGRFIRAMTIASDPTEYRKEYIIKLTKLLERFKPEPEMKFQASMNGLMAKVFVQYNTDPNGAPQVEGSMDAWKKKTQERYGACIFNDINQSQAAGIVTKFSMRRAPSFDEQGVAETARGFFAVPVTNEGQHKMFREVGHRTSERISQDPTSSIDYAGTYEVAPILLTTGKTTRVRVSGVGYVPKGHPVFGRLVKAVIAGLQGNKS
jgi:hypothetical protein